MIIPATSLSLYDSINFLIGKSNISYFRIAIRLKRTPEKHEYSSRVPLSMFTVVSFLSIELIVKSNVCILKQITPPP